jgi:hypothetical protein
LTLYWPGLTVNSRARWTSQSNPLAPPAEYRALYTYFASGELPGSSADELLGNEFLKAIIRWPNGGFPVLGE